MKCIFCLFLCFSLLSFPVLAEDAVTEIIISDTAITVDGAPISEDASSDVFLAYKTETHEDVPAELADIKNRVVTITSGGEYSVSGSTSDLQIAIHAPDTEKVSLILAGTSITCRTAPAIAVYSALDDRIPGEYGASIVLKNETENFITGSHTSSDGDEPEFDGAIGSQVSLGVEGSGALSIVGDKEGIEVAFGHLTINGGNISISSGDDPLNVSEDEVGVLTINDGVLYSAVSPVPGGEGDGVDSNGYIEINGGTVITLAHPESGDSGIDSDLGSTINGGVVVGAGNMYDAIDPSSEQLFMFLEFSEPTDGLIAVTDGSGLPVFAFELPHEYMYLSISYPGLAEGSYRVYSGGDIQGESFNGFYTSISSYSPGTPLQHGGNSASRENGELPMEMNTPPQQPDMPGDGGFPGMTDPYADIDLNAILEGCDLNDLLEGKDLNGLLTGFAITDILTDEQISEYFGDADPSLFAQPGMRGGMGFGGPGGMDPSSADATTVFDLSRGSTGFTGVTAAE